ncbi:sensor histidine kinase [Clostridium beijerinckii]|jgi:Signal transduction histidine kinase regulating citrate/malate metabolism|uniref:histidine kinase n=3 Tax=Clostridiaceae TaxID=31979 RepID=A0A1S8QSG9_CLOBE|nr:sensor histidine kinase [Clostridium beijerinckii]ABR36285.1 signal transduction histidine kinase regulating citrate/malate metabolism [Clostridium beijerinckii NCIMB 8052]AIU01898.1 signal transduction histidine kinase regulating citrate/malate metabolism [Clostridium beijerinckii ATCC 35702]MBF7809068.1 sensor histidine kinase [Clostridium beijerinckii]NOW89560.1 two-component system sensor histidine kinase YcbA [Clostridium beijerinckii]NRT22654.1 two-component system sensor histidine ki
MMYKIKMTERTKICLKNSVLFSVLISILAQIYIYPFNSRFVLGVGVIVIGLIFSISENIYPVLIGIITGTITASIRSIGLLMSSSNYSNDIIMQFMPAAIFYIIYGILGTIFPLTRRNKSIIHLYLSLISFDIICNTAEILVRNMFSISTIKVIIVTALVRAFIQCSAFLIYKYQKLYIKTLEHQKRYAELNLMVSKIYAEAFYLQKSTNDLNTIMREAYNLYEMNKDKEEFSVKALSLAQNAHEIRKNNDRVLRGINQLVQNVEKAEYMSMSEIFCIISDNTKRQIDNVNSNIFIKFKLEEDYSIKRYYDIFAILNNLIINAIEACSGDNMINVIGEISQKELLLDVSDNGTGIDKDVLPYIFNIGFSTKFNEETGAMSTGIGLCHVKNLLENLGGSIEVESDIDRGTKFLVKIPLSSI